MPTVLNFGLHSLEAQLFGDRCLIDSTRRYGSSANYNFAIYKRVYPFHAITRWNSGLGGVVTFYAKTLEGTWCKMLTIAHTQTAIQFHWHRLPSNREIIGPAISYMNNTLHELLGEEPGNFFCGFALVNIPSENTGPIFHLTQLQEPF